MDNRESCIATTISIYHQNQRVAHHSRLSSPGATSTNPKHLPPETQAYETQNADWCLSKAENIGPYCAELVLHILTHPIQDLLRSAQAVIRLSKKYDNPRIELACKRASLFESMTFQTVKEILEKDLEEKSDDKFPTHPTPLSAIYTGKGLHQRNIDEYMAH
jgi:hypothetical protein